MSLFGRVVEVQIGTEGSSGRAFRGLRARFDVAMTDTKTPNTGKVELYNAAPETIALAQRDDAVVRLLVGHGDTPRLIFHGDPIKDGVTVRRESVDRILTIEAADGRRAYSGTFVDLSFATEQTGRQIYGVIGDALGLPLGANDLGDDVRFPTGVTLSGRASDVLDRLCVMTGRRWTIRDGTLQVYAKGGTTGESAVLFSPTTGLVGAPTRTEKGVELTALISPAMRPGRPFRLESEFVSGDYVAKEVRFAGDSGWERDFYVHVTGVPL